MSRDTYWVLGGSGAGLELQLDQLIGVLQRAAGVLGDDDELVAREHLSTVLARAEADVAPPTLERRIGGGRFLAVGSLSRLGLGVVLGPLLHAVGTGVAISSAIKLLRFDAQLRPRVLALYARLEGVDRQIFEAVHEIQSQYVVVNFDALGSDRPATAFGRRSATLREIVQLIESGEYPEIPGAVAIADAAGRLVARGILRTDGATFAIRF
jgi:hypothetical protein